MRPRHLRFVVVSTFFLPFPLGISQRSEKKSSEYCPKCKLIPIPKSQLTTYDPQIPKSNSAPRQPRPRPHAHGSSPATSRPLSPTSSSRGRSGLSAPPWSRRVPSPALAPAARHLLASPGHGGRLERRRRGMQTERRRARRRTDVGGGKGGGGIDGRGWRPDRQEKEGARASARWGVDKAKYAAVPSLWWLGGRTVVRRKEGAAAVKRLPPLCLKEEGATPPGKGTACRRRALCEVAGRRMSSPRAKALYEGHRGPWLTGVRAMGSGGGGGWHGLWWRRGLWWQRGSVGDSNGRGRSGLHVCGAPTVTTGGADPDTCYPAASPPPTYAEPPAVAANLCD
uniref:Uncharacterized protein n=1 Tax=Oryza glumipatula TaxID=40148 RepID=A0A0E0B0A4_9ORYZ